MQQQASSKNIGTLIDTILNNFIDIIIQILFALALMYFLFGVFGFVRNAGNEAERAKSAKVILWGIIGLAVMIAIWGLVAIVAGTFGQSIGIPQIKL